MTMNKEVKLSIGDIGISIEWEDSRMLGWPHSSYENFISSIRPQISLNICCTGLPPHSSQLLFDAETEGYWKLFQRESGYIIEIFNTLTGEKNKVCFLEPDFRKGEVYVDPQYGLLHSLRKILKRSPSWSFHLLMQPLVQLLLVNMLAGEQGFMVHGLGIDTQGKGIAFLGGSGTGKSTMAQIWRGREGVDVLSDEHIIVRKKNGQYRLYGTPWPGMANTASSGSVQLDRIYFIEHASENKILGRGTPGDIMPLLFLPFWDKQRLGSVLDLCKDLYNTLDWKKLGFLKDESVVEFVRGE